MEPSHPDQGWFPRCECVQDGLLEICACPQVHQSSFLEPAHGHQVLEGLVEAKVAGVDVSWQVAWYRLGEVAQVIGGVWVELGPFVPVSEALRGLPAASDAVEGMHPPVGTGRVNVFGIVGSVAGVFGLRAGRGSAADYIASGEQRDASANVRVDVILESDEGVSGRLSRLVVVGHDRARSRDLDCRTGIEALSTPLVMDRGPG